MLKFDGIVRLLLVHDGLTEADNLTNVLRSMGYAVRASRYDQLADVKQALIDNNWDLMIAKEGLSGISPQQLNDVLQQRERDLPCVVLAEKTTGNQRLLYPEVQDVVFKNDMEWLTFICRRELNNLAMRRRYRLTERILRESEKRARLLLDNSRDATAYLHEGMHIYANEAYLNLFSYELASDIEGLPFLDLVMPKDQDKFKKAWRKLSAQLGAEPDVISVQCLDSDGQDFEAHIKCNHADIEGEACIQIIVTKEVAVLSPSVELNLIDEDDVVSGVLSRSKFIDQLEQIADKASEGKADAALLYIVIDDFQRIKQQIGWDMSDVILKNIATSLQIELLANEVVGRYSDQVFTLIINNDVVEQRANAFRQQITAVAQASEQALDLHCSIGISRISEKRSSTHAILEAADQACLRAQQAGGDQVVHAQTMTIIEDNAVDALVENEASAWKAKLETAIKEEAFTLRYQAMVNLYDESQQLYSASLHLESEEGENVTEQYLDYAQQLGMMEQLDQLLIKRALCQLSEHKKQYPKTKILFKLSKQTFLNTGFVDWLSLSLLQYKLTARELIFEINEVIALADLNETKAKMAKLKTLSCHLALGQFGSGLDFSKSLDALEDVAYFRINPVFTENLTQESDNQVAIKAIVETIKQVNKVAIAEGVSDSNSLALLCQLGVDYVQGDYIHAPSVQLDYLF